MIDRYLAVEEHNKDFSEGKVPYELALNEFSYLTYDELVQQRTGSSETNETGIPYVPELKRGRAAATDENFSWLNTPDVVQAVQNQGSCGSCWAFAGKILRFQSISIELVFSEQPWEPSKDSLS